MDSAQDFPEIFNPSIAEQIINDEIHKNYDGTTYNPETAEDQLGTTISHCIDRLLAIYDNKYKFITHSFYHISTCRPYQSFSKNLWNEDSDFILTVTYSNESLTLVITLWAIEC